jgi:5'-methylthioadenosine phosphorylase
MMAKVGIIGGSGLYDIEGIKDVNQITVVDTPFGPPSDILMTGILEGVEIVFVARHGRGHRTSPSDINYRANIFEMKRLGVQAILSVSACGSLRESIKPLHFVVPDQFIDRTVGRQSTFFTKGIVAHVPMADPVAPELRQVLIDCAKQVGVTVHEKGTYVNMEGPQFSTRAESNLYRSWGMDIIGMTNATEAKLAREAEISYATLAAVTDYDCWYTDHASVTIEMIIQNLTMNIKNASKILKLAIPRIGHLTQFSAQDALKDAIISSPDMISEKIKTELKPIIGKYIK